MTAVSRVPSRFRLRYYSQAFRRRVSHYADKRWNGYTDRGSLEVAAESILAERACGGFRAGSHFGGVWPRDLCFAAPGCTALGLADPLLTVVGEMIDLIDDTFYTDFHGSSNVAAPAEGIDTFPALVVLLDEVGGLTDHADALARLASLHRQKFFDDEMRIVTGAGSSWWDSASVPRETYNTAILLAAAERLRDRGVDTVYTGDVDAVRAGLFDHLWNGSYFDEYRGSGVLACDANVVPLYFGLLDEHHADAVVDRLAALQTDAGVKMRARPFTRREVRPHFALHPDYHYHVWPWNSFMYATGLGRYGFADAAEAEMERIERRLAPLGNFLEVLALDGSPYVKLGYASAEDFTVAAALWVAYRHGAGESDHPSA